MCVQNHMKKMKNAKAADNTHTHTQPKAADNAAPESRPQREELLMCQLIFMTVSWPVSEDLTNVV